MGFKQLICLGLLLTVVLNHKTANTSILVEESSSRSRLEYKPAVDSFDFKTQRKIGVGLSAAGSQGLAGVNFEINFSAADSFMANFGLGSGFQSLGLKYKKTFGGRWFAPYMAGGYAHWYTAGGDKEVITHSNPSFLVTRFLNESERNKGEFAENLIYPSFGLQYHQLSGEWAGASLFAEVLLLIDLDDLVSAATGELGLMFFF